MIASYFPNSQQIDLHISSYAYAAFLDTYFNLWEIPARFKWISNPIQLFILRPPCTHLSNEIRQQLVDDFRVLCYPRLIGALGLYVIIIVHEMGTPIILTKPFLGGFSCRFSDTAHLVVNPCMVFFSSIMSRICQNEYGQIPVMSHDIPCFLTPQDRKVSPGCCRWCFLQNLPVSNCHGQKMTSGFLAN